MKKLFYLFVALLMSQHLLAATIVVTNGNDSGAGSLRDAVSAANSGDVITFSGVSTVSLTSGQLDINKSLTIDGSPPGVTVTRTSGTFRIIYISGAFNVSLQNLTISNGSGGGIYAGLNSQLNLRSCVITGNESPSLQGGGILHVGGTNSSLTMDFCTVSSNSTGNISGAHGAGGVGSAAQNNSINNSTFDNNTSATSGGAFRAENSNCTYTFTNCTFSNNTATSAGGGAFRSTANNHTITFVNCTITGNRTLSGSGGGVSIASSNTVLFTNTLVAGNFIGVSPSTTPNDVSANILSTSTNNLFGVDTDVTGISNGSNGNLIGTSVSPIDPLLSPLAFNGGATQTIGLINGSPAIDAGTSTDAPTTDQRGYPRVGNVDIGAFEYSTSCSQVATATENMGWNGSVSSDWNNPCNWTPNGIPTATNRVVIPNAANDPVVTSGTSAVSLLVYMLAGAVLTINSGGSLTVANSVEAGTFVSSSASIINHGTLTLNASSAGSAALDLDNSTLTNYGTFTVSSTLANILSRGNSMTLVNEAAGVINSSGGRLFWAAVSSSNTKTLTNRGTINHSSPVFLFGGDAASTLNNYGIITCTGAADASIDGSGIINNFTCGKISTNDGLTLYSPMTINNAGFIQLGTFIRNQTGANTINNTGVFKYNSIATAAGTLTFNNNTNASIIVNNSTPIFTYGGIYNGPGSSTINGIYTEANAPAGTFTAPNTFMPSGALPAGSQTLYAKINPSVGVCEFVVPFTYNNVVLTPDINLKGNSVTIENGDVSPIITDHTDFGPASVTGGTVTRTFTIENKGTGDLTLGTVTGTTSDFNITQPLLTTLPANSSTTFTVTFDPTAAGKRMTIISIANNDTDENPYTFAIEGYGGRPFITTWNAGFITIPTTGTGYNYDVDWNNDGIYDEFGVTGNATHNYSTAGTYTVAIRGSFPRIFFDNDGTNNEQLLSLVQWGDIDWKSMQRAFYGCNNLQINANDTPDLDDVTDMSGMFTSISAINQDITGWEVGHVTNMGSLFGGVNSFNQDISGWNVGNVTNMSSMFAGTAFNQDISGWNISNVLYMGGMFGQSPFNKNISGWDVSNVMNMSLMFSQSTAFNQDIGAWNVANVTDMSNMFFGATSFNQSLAAWGTKFNANVNLTNFLDNCGMNVANYDVTLTGFRAGTVTGRTMGAAGLQYCASAADRVHLVLATGSGGKGWTISNDAQTTSCLSADINLKGNTITIDNSDTTPSITDHTDFGPAKVTGGTVMRTFTIENTGTGALTLGTVTGATSDFSITQPLLTTLPAGGNTTFTVTFDPTATGKRTTTISVANNDTDENPYTFAIEGYGGKPFITTWKTNNLSTGSSTGTSIMIPTTGSGYNYDVDWNNDGIFDEFGKTGSATHDYGTAGTYTVAIRGSFPRIYFNNAGDKVKILSVDQWGDIAWTSMGSAFFGCSNLTIPATDVPNLTGVTDMSQMFRECTGFTQALPEGFNTASVTNMQAMFYGCSAYNHPLPSSFNTANVTDMSYMFAFCSAYNQPLPSSFNTAKVTDMSFMFRDCSTYNRALPSSFNTVSVRNMLQMFENCSVYNQALPSSFNTASVEDMSEMFFGCSAYNQALPSSFSTASVRNMYAMFYGCSSYDQALPSSFNTANVTDMSLMFFGCSAYNQAFPSNFTTASVTNMSIMFSGAAAFDQNLGALNLEKTTSMTDMLKNSGLSIDNYDATLIGWNTAGYTNKNLGDASPLRYCAAQSARAELVTRGWTINNDTYSNACLTAEINLKSNGNNIVNGDNTPTGSDFTDMGAAAVTGATIVRSFTIENTGVSNLVLNSNPVSITGAHPTDFTITQPALTTIPAGGNTTFTVTFDPSAAGLRTATVSIANNDADENPYIFAIQGYGGRPFITTWKTNNAGTSSSTSLRIPTTGSGYNYDVDWNNDGIFDEFGKTGSVTHDYGTAGTYTVAIRGSFPRIYFNNGGDKAKILSLDQWGDIAWTSMGSAFHGCNNLILSASDVPNTAGVTDMSYMFSGCSSFNQALPAGFNTANVTTMQGMFYACFTYNQALPVSFNTANVTDMRLMFANCWAYDQAFPAGFSTANVRNMSGMFSSCYVFNQVLPAHFTTDNVTNMTGMFSNCFIYNQALPGTFRTTNVIAMGSMFQDCFAYDQALPSSFNTANVTDMNAMFSGCRSYNKALPSSFNTASATSMIEMFYGATAFNQALPSSFNTAKVTDMSGMFYGATAFNQILPSSFNTAKVTDMSQMFEDATAFNQNLGAWNIGAAADMTDMLKNSGLSVDNYDATLMGWNTGGYTSKNLGDASPLRYCAAQSARNNMITNKGWTITGDTYTPSCLNPDYTITTTGGNVIITDVTGTGETLDISENNEKIRFNVTGKAYSIDGGTTTAFTTPAEIPLLNKTGITVNTANGNDIINVGAFSTQLPNLTINGGTGDDQVNLNGSITFANHANLDLDLQNDEAIPGTDALTIADNANLNLSATGIATLRVSKSITFNASSSLVTQDGNIGLITNSIDILSGATLSTNDAGSLTLRQATDGVGIDLGAAANPIGGPLSLSDAELDRIKTGTINVGDANTGPIAVSEAISRTAATAMNLTSGGAVNFNASSLNLNGGNLNINAAGGVNPTSGSTDISVGTVVFTAGNDLNIVINGTTADTDYRQLNVVGSVNLTGLDLVLTGSHTPVIGQTFMIVNNDGNDAISGTFNGLPEGTVIPNFLGSGQNATITYTGGDGNDVVLTVGNPLPEDFALSGGGISFCQTPLSIAASGSQIGVSYQLKRNNVNFGSPIEGTGNPLIFANLTQAGTYTILATANLGNCSRTLSAEIIIQTRNAPNAFNLSGGGASCSGAPVNIQLANSQIGVLYQLKRGSTPVGSSIPGTGNALSFPPQNTAGNYSVTALTACPDLTMNNTVSVISVVTPATFIVTGGGTTCATALPVGLSDSQSGVFYQLYRNNAPVGTTVQGTGQPITLGNHLTQGQYTVVATRAGQCPTTMQGSVLINLIDPPALFNVIGGGTACPAGVPISLSGSQSGMEYQLKRGNTLVISQQGDGTPLTFPNQTGAGTYTVEAISEGNCSRTMSATAIVTSAGTLPNQYDMTGGGPLCNTTTLALGLSDSQRNVAYQLQRNTPSGFVNVGTGVQGTGNALALGNHSVIGEYRVVVNSACLTEMASRKSITACNARVASEPFTEGSLAGASVSPNPVSNTLHLKVSEAKDQKVSVSLLDASGRTLLQRAFTPESNQHQEEFEVSELANGMYFLKVNTAEKQTTIKVIKVE